MEREFYKLVGTTPDIKRHAFENNWPYILQATRNGLFIYRNNNSVVYYTKRQAGEELSESVVIHALGSARKECVRSFAERERRKGIATIVKNVDKDELSWWVSRGFIECVTAWSKYSFRDDNTYPQYVVSRETIETIDYGKDVKYQIGFFDRTRAITTDYYTKRYDNVALSLLKDFSVYSERKGNDSAVEITRGHKFFFYKSIKKKIRLQHTENHGLIGFSFLTPVDDVVFYNVVICKNQRNIMKYLVHQGLRFVVDTYPKVRFFGMQGSENEGQDYLKKRLNPKIVIDKTHLFYA